MKPQSLDTPLEVEKVQIELLRKASVAKRLSLVRLLSKSTRNMAMKAIKKCNPGKSEAELNVIYAEVHYGKAIANQLRDYYKNDRQRHLDPD